MKYNWQSVGDQDRLLHKMCTLGPYILEMIESNWIDDNLMVRLVVSEWNQETKRYKNIKTNLKLERYNRETSHTVLEDWYACNVLLEEHFGSEDEVVQGKRLQR